MAADDGRELLIQGTQANSSEDIDMDNEGETAEERQRAKWHAMRNNTVWRRTLPDYFNHS